MKSTKKTLTFAEQMEAYSLAHKIEMAEIRERINSITIKQAETDRLIKENSKHIFGISESNGKMAEDFIYNSLEKSMSFAGIQFDDIGRNWKLHLKKHNLKGEFDVVLENGDTLAIVEAKYKVQKEHITKLLNTPDNFRKLFPMYKDYKIILGVGGMSFDDEVQEEATKNGIGIIKILGDKIEFNTEIINIY